MKYSIKHRTWYAYAEPAPVCHNLLHLAPRDAPRQTCRAHRLHVTPAPASTALRTDYFGNLVDYFSIEGTHTGLEITSTCTVEVTPLTKTAVNDAPPWEDVVKAVSSVGGVSDADDGHHRKTKSALETPPTKLATLQTFQLTLPSPRITPSPELRAYAAPSFPAGRPIVEAISDLSARIHHDFAFDPKATTVHTPLPELLKLRRGVCQDFAHLAAGCLRSVGLPARYVSGYLRTAPPPGKPRLIGADASHAWASAWCGPLGWIDFDPTNNSPVSDSHISIAWGRDYGDVCPIQGVFVGGGDHTMGVSVDVLPDPQGEPEA